MSIQAKPATEAAQAEFVARVAHHIAESQGAFAGAQLAAAGRAAGILSPEDFRALDGRNRLPDWVLTGLRAGLAPTSRIPSAPVHRWSADEHVTLTVPFTDAETTMPQGFRPGTHQVPAVEVHEVRDADAFLLNFSKVVATAEGVLDQLSDPGTEALWPVVRRLEPRRLEGKTLLLVVEGSAVLSHWMFDTLPRIAMAEAAGHPLRGFDHIVLAAAQAGFHRESLERLGVDPTQLVLRGRGGMRLAMEHCVTVSALREHFIGAGWVYDYTRRLFGARGGTQPARRHIFISRERAGRRRAANEAEIRDALRARGFEVMHAEDHKVAEFAQVMAETRVLLGPHGAGLANLAFMPPGKGGVVGELFGAHLSSEYWRMSCGLGFDYFILQGEDVVPEEGGRHAPGTFMEKNGRDFRIAPERVVSMLDGIEKSASIRERL